MSERTMATFTFLCLLFILPGHASGFLFEIRSSLRELNLLHEEPLEIECSFNPDHSDHSTQIKSVEEIHIIRRDTSKKWTELAKLQANGYLKNMMPDFRVSGKIGPTVNDTFLKLTWEIASNEELGMYRCDVVATDENFEFDIHQSNMLTIFKHNVTTEELLDLSQRQLDNLQLEFDKFRKNTVKKMALIEKSVKELKNESQSQDEDSVDDRLDPDIDQLREDIRKSVLANVSAELEEMTCSRLSDCFVSDATSGLVLTQENRPGAYSSTEVPTPATTHGRTEAYNSTDVSTATTTPMSTPATTPMSTPTVLLATLRPTVKQQPDRPWPTGKFALLNSYSGCPRTLASRDWKEGYMKYHTESVDDNHDNVTYRSNLAEPIAEVDRSGNHFLYMHFCVNHNRNPKRQPWPAGSYCIHQAGGVCPSGFRSGEMDIDEEDVDFSGQSRGVLPDMLFFCCREDGRPDQAITLPSSMPFYLYRFGGQCQEVNDMQVTPEKMIFDTENEQNQDDYQNDIHPDGKLEDVEIELCYYS